MSTKAIIKRRRSPRRPLSLAAPALAEEDSGLESAEVTVEQEMSQGLLISGEEAEIRALEAQGFRVKILPDTNILKIGSFTIDTNADPPAVPNHLEVPKNLRKRWTHHLVQLAGPPNPEWVKILEEQGIDVVEPISSYGLFVVGSPEQVQGLLALPFVSWVGFFKPAYRISPTLDNLKGTIRYVNVGVYPASEVDGVITALDEIKAPVIEQWDQEGSYRDRFQVLIVESQARKLARIARLPNVRWLEYHAPMLETEDERSTQIMAGSLNNAAAPNISPLIGYQAFLNTLGLGGDGVVIGICDTGVDTNDDSTMHPDLRGRMTFFIDRTGGKSLVDGWPHPKPSRRGGHGTHVAGIALGNGASLDMDPQGFLLGQGVAPQANFGVINAIAPGSNGTGPLAELTRLMVENGAHVMNNSWWQPGAVPSGYNSKAALLDKLVRDPNMDSDENDFMVLVFSAGNKGPNPKTITPPKEAKNIITVGNSMNYRPGEKLATSAKTDDIRGINHSSSRGPAVDGRILPTVVAPGTDIISARSGIDTNLIKAGVQPPRPLYKDTNKVKHIQHTPMTGTSMAAPHVAGLCALLIEWWRDNNDGLDPSPAMLKALLINGAVDLAGGPDGKGGILAHIPNNDQGWGRVSLRNIVLDAPLSRRGPKIMIDNEPLAEDRTFVVAPVDPERPLRITLVWTDAPGSANDIPALVNDLDLEVLEVDTNTIYKGNVFNEGFSVTGGAFDNLNNVECVYIQNPTGEYDVTIIPAQIKANARRPFDMTPWQDFALVIDNAQEV